MRCYRPADRSLARDESSSSPAHRRDGRLALREMMARAAALPLPSTPTARAKKASSTSGAAEIEDVLGAEDAAFFAAFTPSPPTEISKATTFSIVSTRRRCCPRWRKLALPGCVRSFSPARASRIRPGLDDKILADWNGLMIAALAKAAEAFDKPQWLAAAECCFPFRQHKDDIENGRLMHAATPARERPRRRRQSACGDSRATAATHAIRHLLLPRDLVRSGIDSGECPGKSGSNRW